MLEGTHRGLSRKKVALEAPETYKEKHTEKLLQCGFKTRAAGTAAIVPVLSPPPSQSNLNLP